MKPANSPRFGLLFSAWWAALALGASGCALGGDDDDIDAYIRGIGQLPVEDPVLTAGGLSPAERWGDYSCVRQDFEETRQYDRIVAYVANSDSLWPGAIVSANSVGEGYFTPVAIDRAPMDISISLENLAGRKSAHIERPTLSAVREAVGDILSANVTGGTPANISSEIEEVYSQGQLSLAFGASVGGAISQYLTIGGGFDFASESIKSRYLVRYMQSYYTVDMDPPTSPSAFFADDVGLDEVREKIPPDDPPIYVSSVTYGRMVLFAFESDYSSAELGAALDVAYHDGTNNVTGEVSLTYEEILSNTKITAYILGGSGGVAAEAIDSYEGLMEFIHSGGDYSKESPGAPIAYKLAYMADHTPARMSLTQSYEAVWCERVNQPVLARLKSFTVEYASYDVGNVELYGTITASANNEVTLFDKDGSNYIQIAEGATYPETGYLSEEILDVDPTPGSEITLTASLEDRLLLVTGIDLGTEMVAAPYETGWRRDVEVRLTGGGASVIVTIELKPM